MYENRWYQDEAVFSVFDYFNKGMKGNPIIAMPGGTGKSVVIAKLIKKIFELHPTQRVMMLTHDKRLISQNAEKLQSVWPTAPLGIYSAGLNSRDMILPIVFGGIQSVAPAIKKSLEAEDGKPEHFKHFGHRDLIFVDECHLISPSEATQYMYVFAKLREINPKIKIIGLTATHWRTKEGLLTNNGLFTDICYDITGIEAFERLMREGWLAPLIAIPTETFIDMSEVGVVAGEYNQKQTSAAVDQDKITYSAVREMINKGANRNAWLVFAQSIENAEHINAMLQSFGIVSTVAHSKVGKTCDKRIADFKGGFYQCIVNKDMLTTGFDHPPIDLIGDLQPTMSPGKHVQKYYRGTRPSPGTGKINCLGLDFARNVRNLGPINDPKIPNKRTSTGKPGDAPVRLCNVCGVYNRAAARECFNCGDVFGFKNKLFAEAGTLDIIKLTSESPQIDFFEVSHVIYNLHEKIGSPPSIKVTYFCGLFQFHEWVCLEHAGGASKKARDWWRQRHAEEPPPTTHQALQKISQLRMPARISVHVNLKYPQVLSSEY